MTFLDIQPDENGEIDITPKELEILKVLIDNKGLVLSRNQILDDVWGYDCDAVSYTHLDVYKRQAYCSEACKAEGNRRRSRERMRKKCDKTK